MTKNDNYFTLGIWDMDHDKSTPFLFSAFFLFRDRHIDIIFINMYNLYIIYDDSKILVFVFSSD
jgi:hypothetical protein